MLIPTLFEIYPEKKSEAMTKQQTSLLSAILELHESLRNFSFQPSTDSDSRLQLRVEQLEQEVESLQTEIKALTQDLEDADRALELREKDQHDHEQCKRELQFQLDRFKTLQEHYKNSTIAAKELQEELKDAKAQLATVNLQNAPKGFKSWEEAATVERLHHNQTKAELVSAKDELAVTKLKLDRFHKLLREAMGQ